MGKGMLDLVNKVASKYKKRESRVKRNEEKDWERKRGGFTLEELEENAGAGGKRFRSKDC